MSKSNRKLLSRQKSNIIALQRAKEFSEYHDIFGKYENRKQLKPWEKAQITRKWKQLAEVASNAGGYGFVTPAPKRIVEKLKRENKSDLLLGGFNILKLNQYNEGKTLDLNKYGDIVQKRKYEKAGRDDLTQGRLFTFVFVDCNFDFSTGRYQKLIDNEEIHDRVKDVIIKRYWQSYNKRKKQLPADCEFYLWGKQGVMYKRAASSFRLLMEYLKTWVEMYLDRIIDAEGTVSDELLGWAWHSNVRIKTASKSKKRKTNTQKKTRKNAKKKNSRSGR